MSVDAERIRAALIQSLRAEPLLIKAEEAIHSHGDRAGQAQLKSSLRQTLSQGPAMAEVDEFGYRRLDEEVVKRFRAAMHRAVRGGANLADAELEILQSLGLQKVGEFRSSMKSHLDGPAEVPDRDLAIYLPAEGGTAEGVKRALEDQLAAPVESEPTRVVPAPGTREVKLIGAPATPETVPAEADDLGRLRASLGVREPTDTYTTAGKQRGALKPVPMLAAALETIGRDGDDFGFLLRYGRYASEGRISEFLVGGLGLAELSKRLTRWLDEQGPLDGQVQVVDEGSGELTIYLLRNERT